MNTPPTNLTASEYKSVEVYDTDFRPYIKDMADTVTRLELWDWFQTDPPDNKGYMFWKHPNIDSISNGLQNNHHSGATFSHCMRIMQAIAEQGFDNWNGDVQSASKMDSNNANITKVWAEKGVKEAVKQMFVNPNDGSQMSYAEMRMYYG